MSSSDSHRSSPPSSWFSRSSRWPGRSRPRERSRRMATTKRFDPYKNFKFVVKFGNNIVAGASKVGGLKKTTEVVKHREGADPSTSRKSPGRTEFEAITLERGVTADREFEKWANQVWFFEAQAPGESALGNFRRDITIELRNEAGQTVLRYFVYRCW